MSSKAQGGLYPPSTNAMIMNPPLTRDLPIVTQNNRLRLQIDQVVEVRALGNAKPAEGSTFLIMVFALSDLDKSPIIVSPNYLSLATPGSDPLQPQSISTPPSKNFTSIRSSLNMGPLHSLL